ncbi:MAG TPA: peptidase domain-containing ABC transporter [Candidatus Angelobacter sp.]|nr:peptidase domain-containing ABC transporter [Candidatus Angelobacter sp.]
MRLPFRRTLAVIFQTEATECGLACLAMIAGYHGLETDLQSLRERFSISMRGATLGHLLRYAGQMEFSCRPLRLELEDLPYLKTPCILHWDMTHFVVLARATRTGLVLHDPAMGMRKMSYAEANPHFTGVAMELTPTPAFKPRDESRPLRLRELAGRVTGLKKALLQIFALAAVLEVLAIFSPLFLQLAVDKVATAYNPGLLPVLGIGFMLLVLVQAVVAGMRSWATLYFGTSMKLQWYANIFSHLVRLPVSFFEKRYFGDILSRFESAESIQRTLTNNFVESLLDGIISISILVVMFVYNRELGAVVVLSVGLYVLVRNLMYGRLRTRTEEQIINAARQQTHFLETLRGIRTIKVFGREDSRKSRWMNLLVDTTNSQVSAERLSIIFKSANTLIFGVQSVAVIWLGITLVLRGSFTTGMLFAFVAYEELFKARMIALVDRGYEFRMLSIQAQRLADIVQARPEPLEMELEPGEPQAIAIEVKSLNFRYSEADPLLLKDVDLRIRAGECVAITGPSGAGKSTLLKLMAGLLQPQSGDVIINGHSVCASRAAVLGKVGFVLQDDSLFAGSISSNIAFASDIPDPERIQACARLACLHDEIMAMPMAYETLIGEMGGALSGGQQQRLLLARALYQQPSILILDEATSHLDVPTEQRIAAMLAELRITRIFAAHRPDTVAIADRVISISRTGIVEEVAAPAGVNRTGNSHHPFENAKGGETYVRAQGD